MIKKLLKIILVPALCWCANSATISDTGLPVRITDGTNTAVISVGGALSTSATLSASNLTLNADGASTTNILISATNLLTASTNLFTQSTNLLTQIRLLLTNGFPVSISGGQLTNSDGTTTTNLLIALTNIQTQIKLMALAQTNALEQIRTQVIAGITVGVSNAVLSDVNVTNLVDAIFAKLTNVNATIIGGQGTNVSATIAGNPTNAAPGLFVQGWPLLVTNITITAPSISTNEYSDAAIIELDNVGFDTNWPSVYLCFTMTCNTNHLALLSSAGYAIGIYSKAPTWPATPGSVIATTFTDSTNFLGGVVMTNWNRWGTNCWATVTAQNIGALMNTNWIAIKAINPAVAVGSSAWTNAGQNVLKVTLQKAK